MRARLGALVLLLIGCSSPADLPDAAPDAASDSGTATMDAAGVCGDGVVAADEGCDDGNAMGEDGCGVDCTVDPGFACTGSPSSCVPLECERHSDCDDGLYCNGSETCVDATCVAGSARTLDDGVSCTTDACDEDLDVVVHTPDDAACDDGAFCNGAEVCDASGGCGAGVAPGTDDGIPCTSDSCDESTDTVVHAPSDAACDDGDTCTSDTCTAGVGCAHPYVCACTTAADCDDGNACTTDSCTSGGSCSYASNTDSCDDGLYCNGADVCSGGACTHAGDPCAGGAQCDDACDEVGDDCHAPATTACAGDGNPCTDDRCDGLGACAHSNNTAICDDGLYCNGADVCAGGACIHAGDPCSGGAQCSDVCDEGADACSSPAGTACADDGLACTVDACDGAGTCGHVGPASELVCGDAADGDCDGAIDCADTDCEGEPCGTGGETCSGGTCGCPGGSSESSCTNAIDDDCDGDADCADSECASAPVCSCGRTRCPAATCGGGTACLGGTCGRAGAWRWDTVFGGTGSDTALSIVSLATGGYVVSGGFANSVSFGGPTRTSLGGSDGFVAALDASGAYRWDRVYASSYFDSAAALAVDPSGNIVLAGMVGTSSGGGPLYVRKLDPSGAELWSRTFGTDVLPTEVVVDASGLVTVVGYFQGTADFGGGVRTAVQTDMFILGLSSTGAYRWDHTYDGGGTGMWDAAYAVDVDASGNVYVGGEYWQTVDFGGGPTTTTASGGAFVASYDANGLYRWHYAYATTQPDNVASLSVTPAGSVVVAASFGSAYDFGGGLRTSAGASDALVLSLDTAGNYQWDRVYGGAYGERSDAIDTDCAGNVYVTGYYESAVDFGGGTRSPALLGNRDIVVLSLASTGAYRWDRTYGGSGADRGLAIVSNGDRLGVAASWSTTVSFGGASRTSAGTNDAAVLELDD